MIDMKTKRTWYEAALYCEETYGVYVAWSLEERYFICPECDEPIFESDWEGHDFETCPICEYYF